MRKTLKEIAEHVGGRLEGDGDKVILGIAGIQEARAGHLSFIANEKYASLARDSSATALIVGKDLAIDGFDLIRVEDPARAWERILDLVMPHPIRFQPGVHPSAVVSEEAVLCKDVTVMANATIEAGASIGDRTLIYPGVYVGHHASIGSDSIVYPNVVIRERVEIGDRVILHSGAVIGADGFGFAGDDGLHKKQEQMGTVVVEDEVEIGANVTVDRARFDQTRIGRGTKVDNLVQIAHNVIIGENCMIVSQTGIAGSTRLGRNVIVGGQVGIVGHLTIGNNVRIAAQSGVSKNIPDNETLLGSPAGGFLEKKREMVSLRRLPELLKTVRDLSERVSRLETQSENDKESH